MLRFAPATAALALAVFAQVAAAQQKLPFDPARLVPYSDSMVLMVQGRELGFQRTSLERTGSGFRFTEETRMASVVEQKTVLEVDAKGAVRSIEHSGTARGKPMRISARYSGNLLTGEALTPTSGDSVLRLNVTLPDGHVDDNFMYTLVRALPWTSSARWTFPLVSSGRGDFIMRTLEVLGQEKITVPAGTFDTYRVRDSGGPSTMNIFVTTSQPHRIVKMAVENSPMEFLLVR